MSHSIAFPILRILSLAVIVKDRSKKSINRKPTKCAKCSKCSTLFKCGEEELHFSRKRCPAEPHRGLDNANYRRKHTESNDVQIWHKRITGEKS